MENSLVHNPNSYAPPIPYFFLDRFINEWDVLTYNSAYKIICSKKKKKLNKLIRIHVANPIYFYGTILEARRAYRDGETSSIAEGGLANVGVSLEPWLAVQAVAEEDAGVERKHCKNE